MRLVTTLLALLFAGQLLACDAPRAASASRAAAPATRDLWIRDVTVISAERGAPLPHAHVLVRDGRIAWVDTRPPPAAAEATAIDGSGRYLVPGLIDAHVHLAEIPGVS